MPSFEDLKISPVKSGRYTTTCPKCSPDRKPEHRKSHCLTVNNEVGNRWFNCNHCGHSGNLDIMERFDKVYQKARMPKVRPSLFSKDVQTWLDLKQISAQTALKCGCYEVKNIDGTYSIAYPYYWRKTLRNVMFRRPVYEKGKTDGPREWQISKEHGTETIFWGLDDIDFTDCNELIITEGQSDRMSWVEAGYKNVISLPMGGINAGTTNVDKKLEFLNKEFFELIKDCPKVIICGDNDETGVNTQIILGARIGIERCFKVTFPFNYKDANEVLAGNAGKNLNPLGKNGIHELYKSIKPFPVSGIIRLRDVSADVRVLAQNGLKQGYVTGYPAWDKHLSFKSKLLVGWTGVPGMGKSTTFRDLSVKLISNNDWMRHALYTPESRPPKREFLKIIENYAGMPSNPKWKNCMSEAQYKAAERWVDEHYVLVAPEKNNYYSFGNDKEKPKTLNNLFDYFKSLKRNEGIFSFSIDAWNKIDHQRPSGMSETDFISRELDRVLEFCDYMDLLGFIIAHPTKLEKTKGGNYEIPTMYDIKGSSAWFEKVDIGLCTHRFKYKNVNEGLKGMKELWKVDKFAPSIIDVQKMKFDELGEEGSFEVYMDWKKGDRFTDSKPAWMLEAETNGGPKSRKEAEESQAEMDKALSPETGDLFSDPNNLDNLPF